MQGQPRVRVGRVYDERTARDGTRVLVDRLWQLRDSEDVVGFEHSVEDAVERARRTGGTALLLNPTPVEAVAAVAEAGERMPRKSTLFTPKPRTGLLIRAYEDEPDWSA